MVRKKSERMSMARWQGKSLERWAFRGLEFAFELGCDCCGSKGMPRAFVWETSCSIVVVTSVLSKSSSTCSSSSSSSARSSTSAKIELSLSHLTSSALSESVTTACFKTFALNQFSS